MKVLVACEHSGVVASAFRQFGHDAFSNDIREYSGLSPFEDPEHGKQFHIQDDMFNVVNRNWDLLIAHPNCQYLALSGVKWLDSKYNGRDNGRGTQFGDDRRVQQQKDIQNFRRILELPIRAICVENPVNVIGNFHQKIHPYMFGHNASKATCLWLKGLPLLNVPPEHLWVKPRIVINKNGNEVKRWANQTDAIGAPEVSKDLDEVAKMRAITYPGIALAMARTWA